jgi:hypothetical protein
MKLILFKFGSELMKLRPKNPMEISQIHNKGHFEWFFGHNFINSANLNKITIIG